MLVSEYTWPSFQNKKRPFIHQRRTFEFVIANPRCFVLSDMGTGKTLSVLWAADFLKLNNKIPRVLVISPLSTVQAVWASEIFKNFPHRTYCLAVGDKEYKKKALKAKADFIVTNHDTVRLLEKEILAEQFDLIVIDELTAFKNYSSERTKAMIRIAKKSKGVWGMTGEPTPNRPTEAYGQAKVVNPSNPYIPDYFMEFQARTEIQVAERIWIARDDAPENVYKILQPAIRFVRDECIDIPPCFKQVIEIPMSQQQTDYYNQMRQELIIEYEEGFITAVNAGVKIMKLLQIGSGAIKDDDGRIVLLDDKPRMDFIEQTMEEMGKRRKLIVFSAFLASIAKLDEYFSKKKFKTAYINGSVSSSNRGNHIANFQDGDLEMLFIQPQACAHGVTLTAANTSIWQSLLASGEIFNQANARITRPGQDRKQYIKMPYANKAELRMINILEGKDNVSQETLKLFKDL